ncbi:DUF192 domain-containing protein [Candidatus Uhrbacteria bacterium]|nr:DUF192 domain-containing protein [Candidatus Uhrbacteria bacterium]
MHIDKQARNFIVSGLMIVCVFAVWLFFAKFPDLIRSFDKKQSEITGSARGAGGVSQKNNQVPLPTRQKQLLYTVRIGSADIFVEVAETPAEKTRGLSGRESLSKDQGLIFLFDTAAQYQFWMKNMKFPIDIIWIGADKKVVDITENLDPATYPKTFSPNQSAQYILETNAFFTQTHGIRVGDDVDLSKILR